MISKNLYKSRAAAIENVKRLFSNSPNSDEVSLEEAVRAWGRPDPAEIRLHKAWLFNILTYLKHHNLVASVYSFGNGRRTLDKIRLTDEGKIAIGRVGDHTSIKKPFSLNFNNTSSFENLITFNDVMRMVVKLRKENPEYEIIFNVKLKDDNVIAGEVGVAGKYKTTSGGYNKNEGLRLL
ncbi:MAG: hypothetical protein NUV52_04690 [Candidatus Roizmanbacteria bacterium]|nr:hypothetical protein [Candidatus Roizmanbacteria bacterium]